MRMVRITMLKSIDSLEKGVTYNQPPDLANRLVAQGVAKREGAPDQKPIAVPQTKPTGPAENKVVAPSSVKTPAKNA